MWLSVYYYHYYLERERERERESREQETAEQSVSQTDERGASQARREQETAEQREEHRRTRSRGIKRGTLHCSDDVQRRQRSKEKTDVEGAGREIGLGVLLYASKTEMHASSSIVINPRRACAGGLR